MKIIFRLFWISQGSSRRFFKSSPCGELWQEYLKRIARFTPCQTQGLFPKKFVPDRHARVWVCDHGASSRMLSSEGLAREIQALTNSGVSELHIGIGGPDGVAVPGVPALRPDLRWSFGPMTLPHELAAVVAGEQIYRAWTILKKLPYHLGHD